MGTLISVLEGVKDSLKKQCPEEFRVYHIIYTEFQRYLNPRIGSVSNAFTYQAIFGKNGHAEKIFNSYFNNKEHFLKDIKNYKLVAQNDRVENWGQRKYFDKAHFFQSPQQSSMLKTLDIIANKLLKDPQLNMPYDVINLGSSSSSGSNAWQKVR